MKLCIFDPAHNAPGLKILFPESDYYAIEPCSFFTYTAINHMNNEDFYKLYNFRYETNINNINSNNYETLFIILPFLDCIEGHAMTKDYGIRILKLIEYIIQINNFDKICLFDTYDYDYDPAIIYKNSKINYYFKRNFNKTKVYSPNVFPFPYMMFVTKCVLTLLLEDKNTFDTEKRKDEIFWCGTIFTHENKEFNVFRDRNDIYNKIKDNLITYNTLDNNTFLNTLQKYKIGLDLYGVGDPNKRTFELLASDTLIFTNRINLDWGFETNDAFSEETVFTNEIDFIEKYNLLKNREIYNKCLNNQRFLKQKYMNKEWMRNYIVSNILNNHS
jgi:hypothetical protein